MLALTTLALMYPSDFCGNATAPRHGLSEPRNPDTEAAHTSFLPYRPSGIPPALREHPHWLVADIKGRPVSRCDVGNSKTRCSDWTDFATASRIAEDEGSLWPYIVLTNETAVTVFDVDFKPRKNGESVADFESRCRRAEIALRRLRSEFPRRYEARSKSGGGWHIIVSGSFTGTGGKGCGEWDTVEIYTRGHGVALTGHVSAGHADMVEYSSAKLQALRDEIKRTRARLDQDRAGGGANGSIRIDWAREVLSAINSRIGRPDYPDWRNIASAVFDGVGVEAGSDLLNEMWPEEKAGEYGDMARSLKEFIPWGTLRAFDVNPDDPVAPFDDLLEHPGLYPEGRGNGLDSFRVDHGETLDFSPSQIDELRPRPVIDGFLRRGEVLLLGAESKSRKSWLAQDAAFCVATGQDWLSDESGANGFRSEKARVHVFDLELGSGEIRYRFAKARTHRFRDSSAAARKATENVVAYSFDGQSAKTIRRMLEELRVTLNPGDMVVVDCLYRLVPDGNEVEKVAEVLELVKRLASEAQVGVIVVDHFRKAGDDKARNRFAGSFIKQASASTLVAVEVTSGDILVLSIDARTFHGCNRVHVRFNPTTYKFDRLPEVEVEKTKRESKRREEQKWMIPLKGHVEGCLPIRATDAAKAWGIKRQSAKPRLDRLVSGGWLTEQKVGRGKATEWLIAPVTMKQEDGDTSEL